MMKDSLVTLPTGEEPSSALDYAAAVARSFDAHLTGVAFAQDLVAVERCLRCGGGRSGSLSPRGGTRG